jgi:HK97 gp10 family phage protein
MSEVVVKGLDDLKALLDTVTPKIQRNIMRSALRAGAKVIAAEAKSIAPRGATGSLQKSISVSTRAAGGKITANARATDPVAHLVEYGTKAHLIRARNGFLTIGGYGFGKVVEHPGAKPRPFMRPALDARAQDAVVAAGEQLKARLTKEGLDTADILVEGDT